MIPRFFQSPVVLLLSTALVASAARGQSTSTPPAPAQQSQTAAPSVVIEDILARVNDQVISRSDYDRADQQMQSEAQQRGVTDVEARRKDLLRDLIDQQLLLSKGKELGITGETELIKQLDEIRKQNHLDSMEDLEKAAQAQGVSFEDFKQSQRNGIVTQMVVREEVGRRIQLSAADAQRFYQAHRAEFDQPESERLSEILIPIAEGDDATKVAAAQTKANEVLAKIKGGEDFGATAKALSSGPTAQQGGDLGSFRRGSLAKELEDKTFALAAGQTTEPIRTKQGFVILKVTEHQRGGVPSLKDVEPQVEEAAYMERMQPALRQYLTKLREEAFIDIKPGLVDTGGSPNQTKPIYSAYVPPAPKKKKKTVVTRYRQTTHRTPAPVVASASSSTTAPSTASPSANKKQQASAASPASMKLGKKEKIRFGQAPRETLPPAAGETEHVDAGAPPPTASQQVVVVEQPDLPTPQAAPAVQKKRFSDRTKIPKVKKPKGPQVDPFAPPPATDDETLTQKTQAAPLGLSGDTSKKPKKQKSGEKVRYADTAKPAQVDQTPTPSSTPSPVITPATLPGPATAPAPQ